MAIYLDRSNAVGGGAYYDRSNAVTGTSIAAILPALTASISATAFRNITGASIITDNTSFFYNLDFTPVNGDILAIPESWLGSVISVAATGVPTITPALPNGTQIPRRSYDVSAGIWYQDIVTINAGVNTISGTLPAITASLAANVSAPATSATIETFLPGLTASLSASVAGASLTATIGATLPAITSSLIGQLISAGFVVPINREFVFSATAQVLVTGDTFREIGTAYAGATRVAYDLSEAVSIKACIVSHDHSFKMCEQVTLSSTDDGADWDSGVVAVIIPKAITAQIAPYATQEMLAKLELQASFDNGEDYTWYETILVRQGFVV